MSGSQQLLLSEVPGGAAGYQIERSLRFNSADSTHLSRTPASSGDLKTWTWSCWVKKNKNGTYQTLFGWIAASPSNQHYIDFDEYDTLRFTRYNSGNIGALQTTAVYRDVSAWYHVVAVWDTTQATADNRMRVYVNGAEVTSFSTRVNPTQNLDGVLNSAVQHSIGQTLPYVANKADILMAEAYFIDGQALTPSSFGETDSTTGVWKPKAYTGTYGTNGFYLKFADNSGTTATTLGKDSSGNGNNWTPNNFSVTAGAGNDSLVDTPTPYGTDTGAGGEVRGNYATLNPLTTTAGTYTQGNLRYVGDSSWRRSSGTILVSTGKWYWEVTIGNAPNGSRSINSVWNAFGFGVPGGSAGNPINSLTDVLIYGDNGYANNFGTASSDLGAVSNGDVLSIAVDLDANSYTFRKNNTQVATGTIGGTAGRSLVPVIVSYNGDYGVMDCNFGQRPFAYTAPSGFKALCTQNLPAPTVVQGDDYFNSVLYTGNGTSQSITGLDFSPDLVWVKSRSNAYNNTLVDSVRGVSKALVSDLTAAEDDSAGSYVTAFNSNGFSVGTGTGANGNGATYVGWTWRGSDSSAVSNTQGTITSTVSANTTSGFSIVTYTGNGTSGATIGHGIGIAPQMIILKMRSESGISWNVYHTGIGNTKALFLSGTDAAATSSLYWNNTSPTSTVFTVGSGYDLNKNGATFVAYCFAPVAGFSAFGSYTGNGSADGPFVYTGFRPAYVLIKSTAGSRGWGIFDTKRRTFNVNSLLLEANTSGSEIDSSSYQLDFLSNGFKIRTSNQYLNYSGDSYIYAAFAENPFKHALAR